MATGVAPALALSQANPAYSAGSRLHMAFVSGGAAD